MNHACEPFSRGQLEAARTILWFHRFFNGNHFFSRKDRSLCLPSSRKYDTDRLQRVRLLLTERNKPRLEGDVEQVFPNHGPYSLTHLRKHLPAALKDIHPGQRKIPAMVYRPTTKHRCLRGEQLATTDDFEEAQRAVATGPVLLAKAYIAADATQRELSSAPVGVAVLSYAGYGGGTLAMQMLGLPSLNVEKNAKIAGHLRSNFRTDERVQTLEADALCTVEVFATLESSFEGRGAEVLLALTTPECDAVSNVGRLNKGAARGQSFIGEARRANCEIAGRTGAAVLETVEGGAAWLRTAQVTRAEGLMVGLPIVCRHLFESTVEVVLDETLSRNAQVLGGKTCMGSSSRIAALGRLHERLPPCACGRGNIVPSSGAALPENWSLAEVARTRGVAAEASQRWCPSPKGYFDMLPPLLAAAVLGEAITGAIAANRGWLRLRAGQVRRDPALRKVLDAQFVDPKRIYTHAAVVILTQDGRVYAKSSSELFTSPLSTTAYTMDALETSVKQLFGVSCTGALSLVAESGFGGVLVFAVDALGDSDNSRISQTEQT